MQNYDVVISGCGISGASAAFTLSKSGLSYLLIEKKPDIGIGPRNWQGIENVFYKEDILQKIKKEAGLTLSGKPISQINFFSSNKTSVIKSKNPLCYLVQRGGNNNLERQIIEQIKNPEIKKKSFVKTIERRKNGKIGLRLNTGTKISCDYLFIAEGASSVFSKQFYKEFTVGIAFLLEVKENNVNENVIECYFNNKYAPNGYSYVIPDKEFTTIAVAGPSYKGVSRNHLLKFLKLPQIKERLKKSKIISKFTGCEIFSQPFLFSNGNILFLGGAAGLTDNCFGFGIRYAIYSGYFAANAVISGDINSYKKQFLEKFSKELKTRIMMRKIYDNAGDFVYNNITPLLAGISSRKDVMNLFNRFKKISFLSNIFLG